jgi:hypothetical protein
MRQPCGALFELVTFDHQAYVINKRDGLKGRVSVFQPLEKGADRQDKEYRRHW